MGYKKDSSHSSLKSSSSSRSSKSSKSSTRSSSRSSSSSPPVDPSPSASVRSSSRSSSRNPTNIPTRNLAQKLGFSPTDSSEDVVRLCEKIGRENYERFRSEYGFDIPTEKPVPDSKWKWSKV